MSPTRRREAVAHLQRAFSGLSERRACRVVGQPCATHRQKRRIRSADPSILKAMRRLVRKCSRFGYRRIHAALRCVDFEITRRRVCTRPSQEVGPHENLR